MTAYIDDFVFMRDYSEWPYITGDGWAPALQYYKWDFLDLTDFTDSILKTDPLRNKLNEIQLTSGDFLSSDIIEDSTRPGSYGEWLGYEQYFKTLGLLNDAGTQTADDVMTGDGTWMSAYNTYFAIQSTETDRVMVQSRKTLADPNELPVPRYSTYDDFYPDGTPQRYLEHYVYNQHEQGKDMFPDTPYGIMPLIPAGVSSSCPDTGAVYSTNGMDIHAGADFDQAVAAIEPVQIGNALTFMADAQGFLLSATRTDGGSATATPVFLGSSLIRSDNMSGSTVRERYQLTLVDAEEWGIDVHETVRTATPSASTVISATVSLAYGEIEDATLEFSELSSGAITAPSIVNNILQLKVPRYGTAVYIVDVTRRKSE